MKIKTRFPLPASRPPLSDCFSPLGLPSIAGDDTKVFHSLTRPRSSNMTIFRPCIDLHSGQVKQIVGGTLSTTTPTTLQTNHVSSHPAAHFASLYRTHDLKGAHVIMLGPGNADAARSALAAWPGALQVGGGINASNAAEWVAAGAEKVIVTSHLFPGARFAMERLQGVLDALGGERGRLVVDLSCRRAKGEEGGVGGGARWIVAMDKWQTLTDMEVNAESIAMLEPYCSEFLIHAADNEGLQRGIDEDLVRRLGEWCRIPVTYAGGGRDLGDLDRVREISGGKVDLTIGSALDVFGGKGATLDECVKWNKEKGG
jgi:phosphoribosylformimino-5-aminoimidazole carboxamide ribotide isomerase